MPQPPPWPLGSKEQLMRHFAINPRQPLYWLLLSLGLGGCTLGPDYQPQVATPLHLSQQPDPALEAAKSRSALAMSGR